MDSAGLGKSLDYGRGYSLAERLRELWKKTGAEREGRIRQMRIRETLSLGGKRQLMVIQCGAECFLVGCGTESVESIVRLNENGHTARHLQDESCG